MKRALFVTILLTASFASAFAQTWDNRFNIGGHANIIKFWGGAVNHTALGWQLGGHALYGITPNVQIGLEAGYGCFRPSATGRLIPAADDIDFRTLAIPVNLLARVALPMKAALKPYGVLGLGAVQWDLQNNDKDSPDYGASVHGQRTNATVLVGIGAEWFFADSWAVDARAQNAFLLDQKLDNTGYGDDANSMMFQGRVGVSFYFGGKKDEEKPPLQSYPVVLSPAVEREQPSRDTAPSEVVTLEPPAPPAPVEESPVKAPEAEVIPDQVDAALVLQGVNFEFNKDELTSEARTSLDNVTKKLQDLPEVRVRIVGYTDNTGTERYNVNLSVRRAESVKRYLVEKGISASRLETAGRGDREPIATNETEEGRAQNRRIEFVRLQ